MTATMTNGQKPSYRLAADTGIEHRVDVVVVTAIWNSTDIKFVHDYEPISPGCWLVLGSTCGSFSSMGGAKRSLRKYLSNSGYGCQPHARFLIHETRFVGRPGFVDRSDVGIYCYE